MLSQKCDDCIQGRTRTKNCGDTVRSQLRNVVLRNRTAQNHQDIFRILLSQQRHDPRDQGIVSTGEDAEADTIHVLFDSCMDNTFRRLAQTRVEHFHARIPQGVGDHFGTAVVTVEARFGDQDTDRTGWKCLIHYAEW